MAIDIDYYAPEMDDDTNDSDNIGRVVVDGWSYTPGEVRDFADGLKRAADAAERAAFFLATGIDNG